MAKPIFGKNVDPSVGKDTQFGAPNGNDPTRGGRPVSIRSQLKDLLEAEGNVTMPANQVISVNNDGSVTLKLPTQMQLAMKLSSWAMSKKGNDSLKAIQMIMEQVDGKPTQEVNSNVKLSMSELTPEERRQRLIEYRNRLNGTLPNE